MIVVMVVDAWDQPFNGTVVSSRRFAEALLARGVGVRVMALEGQENPVAGVELCEFPRLSIPGVNGMMETMRVMLAKPDRCRIREALTGASVLHVQFPLFLGACAISEASKIGLPIVASFHLQAENILRNLKLPTPLLARGVYALMRRFIFDRCDTVIAPSVFARDLIRQVGIATPVEVLSNGIPAHHLKSFRLREGLPQQVRVLCVGRQAAEKRYDIILRALAALEQRDRFHVTFAGLGPERDSLQRLSNALGVNATFTAPSDPELELLYANADLFLHAGESELEGMSVMQAMAAGVPAIVSNSKASAAGELTAIPESRFDFPSSEHLADRIRAFDGNPALVQQVSRENAEAMLPLAHERSVKNLLAIYAQICPAGWLTEGINEAA